MVLGGAARQRSVVLDLARVGARLGLTAIILLGAVSSLQRAIAEDDTRTLSFHHVHTGESITVTFKRNGRYDAAALKKLDWFMRDWRRQRETHMDPRLFDILWQAYRDVGATRPIEIICGYRAPSTNAMLHTRSRGVAEYSQHILGKAIDFFIPGVPLAKLRAVGLQFQRGGVGFYPSSGSPFVHMDVGTVRHWPGISRQELVKLFPHGRTVHIPADGHPLPGYAQALAEIERRGNAPNARSLQAARAAGLISAHDVQVAELVGQGRSQSLVAMVETGKGHDYGAPGEAPVPEAKRASTVVASLIPAKPIATRTIVPLPAPRPRTFALAAVASNPAHKPASKPAMTVAAANLFDARGIWTKAIEAGPALPPPRAQASPFELASTDPSSTGSTGDDVLAYASDPAPTMARPTQARPMGAHVPGLISTAHAHSAPARTAAAAAKPLFAAPMAIGGQNWGSPWLRAALLTPSVSGYMTTSRMGKIDPRWQHELLYKPARAVLMTFAPDPQNGMLASRFTGSAVVFLATATFTRAQTASLQ